VSDRGGSKEIIEDYRTGLIARAESIDDWVEKIVFLRDMWKNHPQRFEQMKKGARQNILNLYSWESVIKQIFDEKNPGPFRLRPQQRPEPDGRAFLNNLAGHKFEAHSAGLEAGELNPLAVEVMREVGIDISRNKTKSVFELYRRGKLFSYVVKVCDSKAAERCPHFPGLLTETINWNVDDPQSFSGTPEEKLEKMRQVRDIIKEKALDFIQNFEAADKS